MSIMAVPNSGIDEIEALENLLIDLKARRRANDDEALPHLTRTSHRMLRDMSLRAELFDPRGHLFGDPAWAIMLFIFHADSTHRPVSVTDAVSASCAPETTGLRYTVSLTNAGYLTRRPDWRDRRRAFLSLSEKGAELMKEYLKRSPWV